MHVARTLSDDHVRPDFTAAALITIDVQCDFLSDGAAAVDGTTEVLQPIQDALEWFRARLRRIVHVVRLYKPHGSNVDVCRRALIESGHPIVSPDSAGAQLAAALRRTPDIRLDARTSLNGELQPLGPAEWAIYKPRWGAFYQTRLEEHLRTLVVATLVFVGCNFPNCPRMSVYEASERDFRIVIVSDAVSGIYDRGVRELESIGVKVMSTAALLGMTV